jgi:four helix bundle protein
MSNIAEGFARSSDKDYAHFLDMAKGSVLEVQSLFYVSLDVGYIEKNEFEKLYKLADETISLISGFASYLRKSSKTDS